MTSYGAQDILALDTQFLATTRRDQANSLLSDDLFDFTKISALRQHYGLPNPIPSICTINQVAIKQVQTEADNRLIDAPVPTGIQHPIFERTFRRSPHRWFVLRNVYLSFNVRNNGAPQYYIFDAERRLINGLFFGATPFFEEPSTEITSPAVLCDDFFPKPNICHFLFDKLPRFFYARSQFSATCPIFFHGFDYAEELLALVDAKAQFLSIPERRYGTVFLSELAVCSDSFTRLCHPGGFGAAQVVSRLRALTSSSAPARRRVLLRRAEGLPRSMQNAAEVEALAAGYGFEIHDPATLLVADQIELFSTCAVLLGVHGAGLSNLAWMPPGGTVIELLPPLSATHAYWLLSHGFGHRYETLVCEDPEATDLSMETFGAQHNRRNVVVPLKRLDQVLRTL